MSRIKFLAPLALLLPAACCDTCSTGADTAALIAAATDLDQRFQAAFNSGDGNALATMYWDSPDAVSFPPDSMIVRGKAVAAGQAKIGADMKAAGAVLSLTEAHHTVLGDAVATWGLWTMSVNGPDGKPIKFEGRYSDLKAQRDGKWVYLMDHASSPASAGEGQ